ncbi:MAG: hypothetical protein OXJ64_04180 [Boseongicola sp.]|nr:hypothetical protein [Boseongicola sp.]
MVRSTGLVCDQVVRPDGINSATDFPDKTRRVKYRDQERDKTLVFLTDNFALPAMTVADICRSRWQVELFSSGSSCIFGKSLSSAPRGTP